MNLLTSLLLGSLLFGGCGAQQPGTADADTVSLPATNYYEITTPQGRMVVRLFDDTPAHRDNFKRLAAEGFYDGTLFHRVIDGFMAQGGDPNSRDDNDPYNDGQGDPGYTLPHELSAGYYHRRGALAAARQGDHVNPERRSSGSQFYLVDGRPFDGPTLDQIEVQLRQQIPDPGFTFTDEQRETYRTVGGAPFLDGQYTVFGEIVEGLDVLDALAAVATGRSTGQPMPPSLVDRPLKEVAMTVRPLPDYQAP